MSKTDYYSEAAHGPHEIFELGNYLLEVVSRCLTLALPTRRTEL
jgi:hypothetical protein